jgi:integrase
MGCTVKRNRHGYLALRLYHGGRDWTEGLALRDTRPNRTKAGRVAAAIAAEMRAGVFSAARYAFYFPHGNRLATTGPFTTDALPCPAPPPDMVTLREYADCWLARQQLPLVRAAQRRDYLRDIGLVLRMTVHHRGQPIAFGDLPLAALAPSHLLDLRQRLLARKLSLKTCRNILDASLRAMIRDARTVDLLLLTDPFAALRWPRVTPPAPDPLTEEERDRVVDWFRTRRRFYFPFISLLFFTGLRPSEATALRWGDVDLTTGTLTVRASRYLGQISSPKTAKSRRTIALQPLVVRLLRDLAPLRLDPDAYVFTNAKNGGPINQSEWPKDHWRAALRATGIRPRKFYSTRHTFISAAPTRGVNLKFLADYCGTSVQMIERSYGRFLAAGTDHQLALLAEPSEGGRGGDRGPVRLHENRNLRRGVPVSSQKIQAG